MNRSRISCGFKEQRAQVMHRPKFSRILLMDKVHKTGRVRTIPKISGTLGLAWFQKIGALLGILGLCRFVKVSGEMILNIYIIIYSSQSLRFSISMRVSIRICAQCLQFSLQEEKMENRTPVLHFSSMLFETWFEHIVEMYWNTASSQKPWYLQ